MDKKLIILLIVFAFALKACGQSKPENTFTVPAYFNAGFYIGSDPVLHNTWPSGGGSTDWGLIINKPTFYPVDLTVLDTRYKPISYTPTYAGLPDKPAQIDFMTAIPQMSYLPLPQKTTTEIAALSIPTGTIAMVWDKTLNVLKIWNGTTWKVFIAGN